MTEELEVSPPINRQLFVKTEGHMPTIHKIYKHLPSRSPSPQVALPLQLSQFECSIVLAVRDGMDAEASSTRESLARAHTVLDQ